MPMIIKNLTGKKNENNVIGCMSGTSLDGLDLVFVNYSLKKDQWKYKLICSTTFKFDSTLETALRNSRFLSGEDLMLLDLQLGNFIGESINKFIQNNKIDPQDIHAIASHGHTVFHQVDKGLSTQIGNGNAISVKTNLPCINDFRQKDVCLGGQGAPLVPIGDLHLFSEYDVCLNLGGIANASFKSGKNIHSFDICPMNLSLNYIAQKVGFQYDNKGEIARGGEVNSELLEELNELNYYGNPGPKSLGIEWLDQHIFNKIEESEISLQDLMRTFVEHQAFQIAKKINDHKSSRVLITGGGVFNDFFIERLRNLIQKDIEIPSKEIVEFKEALIFSFLGSLYLNSSFNVLSSVTGSIRNSISGTLHLPY